ncbi:MAG: flagellar basal body rod protein FlgF [Sphingomonadales bacterium]
MDRLIYSSLSAMRSSLARQTATANNIANAETPGFRADIAETQALWMHGAGSDSRAVTSEEVLSADMKPGTVAATGRPLDVALNGDAMFVVQSQEGEEAYTRRGDFQLGDGGLLTTGDGRPVMGSGGPIIVPPADSILIDGQGRLIIVPAGGDASQPQEVAQLRLVSGKGSDVVKGMDNLFRVRGGGVLPDDPDASVKSGHLEGSNVSTTKALVDMIEASRSWDMQLKLISDARDNDSAAANLMKLD